MIDYDEEFEGINIPTWRGGYGYGGYGGFGGWGYRGDVPFRGNQRYRGYNSAYWGIGNFGGGWPHQGLPKSIPHDYNACFDWVDYD